MGPCPVRLKIGKTGLRRAAYSSKKKECLRFIFYIFHLLFFICF